MDDEKIKLEDESGDRRYFTIVPNYVLNHSTALDQALYLQLKRFAGEGGVCFASQKTLCKKLRVDHRTLKRSFDYLISHKWISPTGVSEVNTIGGVQSVNSYKINDLWKMNNDYYQGVVKQPPPSQRGGLNVSEGVVKMPTKKNREKKIEDSNAVALHPTNEFILLFKGVNPTYERLFGNKTQRAAMERLLAKFGAEKIRRTIESLPGIISQKYAPQITTPLELENKLAKLIAFVKQERGGEKGRGIVFIQPQ
jgi:hypothetical protein